MQSYIMAPLRLAIAMTLLLLLINSSSGQSRKTGKKKTTRNTSATVTASTPSTTISTIAGNSIDFAAVDTETANSTNATTSYSQATAPSESTPHDSDSSSNSSVENSTSAPLTPTLTYSSIASTVVTPANTSETFQRKYAELHPGVVAVVAISVVIVVASIAFIVWKIRRANNSRPSPSPSSHALTLGSLTFNNPLYEESNNH